MGFVQEHSKKYIRFLYRTYSVKINDQIFINQFKKPCFWPIFDPFSQFCRQMNFYGKCQNLEKTNDTIPSKSPDRRTEGWTEALTEPIS